MTQTAKLTASDGMADDNFGDSVAISGNTLVVGALNATVGGNPAQGAAYVFTEPSSGWADTTQTAKLTASDGAAGDCFGCSVSISGNTVVVGAVSATVIGDNVGPGAAYVFGQSQAASPVVSAIAPPSGPTAGGTPVTITGAGFTGATAVNFGGTAATSFTVVSDTEITAVSPAGTGAVDIDGDHGGRHLANLLGRSVQLHAGGDGHQPSLRDAQRRHAGDDHGGWLYRRHGGELRRHGGHLVHGRLGYRDHGREPGGDGDGGCDGHQGKRHFRYRRGRSVHVPGIDRFASDFCGNGKHAPDRSGNQ